MLTNIVQDAIRKSLGDNPKEWEYDRSKSIGGSEIGQCARKIWADKNKFPKDRGFVESRGALTRGNIIEEKVFVPALRERFGKRVLKAGRSQQTFILGKLSATPDSIIYPLKKQELGFDHGDCVIIECKSRDPRARQGELPEHYRLQAQVQMGLVRKITDYKPTHAIVAIINASFLDEVEEHVVKYDETIFLDAITRAGQIMSATTFDEMRPEGYIAGGKECEYCPWAIRCGAQRKAVPDGQMTSNVDPQFGAELDHLASRVKMAQKAVEEAETFARGEMETLKSRMREKDIRAFVGNHYKVNWTPVKGRTTTNMDALEAECSKHGIVLQQFQKEGTPGDRVTVTPLN